MGEMRWRKADGEDGSYSGPLFELGEGIPRRMGDHSIRRALFDLAFGYVSGFPVRDIIPFSLRRLFPDRRVYEAIPVEVDLGEPQFVGTAYVVCPSCDEAMPAVVRAEIVEEEDGGSTLTCTPDMTDIYAHTWSHAE